MIAMNPTDDLSFEAALAELEGIVRALEGGDTTLEQSLAQYERGVGLLKLCYGQLRHAEQRILLLTGEDGEGRPLMRPFEHVASIEAAQGDGKGEVKRGRKRPAPDA
jgi:exodeoxyribonuclease VII small subunit